MSPLRPDLVECWVYRVTADRGLEILLIRRAPGRILPGLWQCVTGALEPGERVALGALREVIEARADKPITTLRCVARRADGTEVLTGTCVVYTMQP